MPCVFGDTSLKRYSPSAGNAQVVSLQAHNPESITAWKLICEVSMKELYKVYDRLDIKLTEQGESFYTKMLEPIVKVRAAVCCA